MSPARRVPAVLWRYAASSQNRRRRPYSARKARRCGSTGLLRVNVIHAQNSRALVESTVREFGRLNVLVSNAAFQMDHPNLEDITDEEWDYTWATNVSAYCHLVKAALPHLKPGASIIGTSSVNSDQPSPTLLPYAATKAAIASISASLAQLLADRGIRANSVAPEHRSGRRISPPRCLKTRSKASASRRRWDDRRSQPNSHRFTCLAFDEASYVSGARIAVTGGKPIV